MHAGQQVVGPVTLRPAKRRLIRGTSEPPPPRVAWPLAPLQGRVQVQGQEWVLATPAQAATHQGHPRLVAPWLHTEDVAVPPPPPHVL
jgi:hypothetical protein